MGIVAFAGLMLLLLWLAATDAPRFCAATLLLAGVPMTLFTGGQRYFSGSLDADAQAIYMFVVATGTILALLLRPAEAQEQARQRLAILVLLTFAAASLAWTGSVVYGVRMLVKLAAPLLFLALVAIAVGQGLNERTIRNSICGAGLISIGLAATNYLSGGAIAPRLDSPGLAGLTQLAAPFTSPADFSFTLSGALFVAYGEWTTRRRPASLAVAAIMAVGLLLALCRAAIVGALLGLLVFHVAGRRLESYKSVLAVAILLLAGLFVLNTQAFKARMFFDPSRVSWSMLVTDRDTFLANVDTSGRNELWQEALRDFAGNSTLFGGGIGSVDRWVRDRYVRGSELHSDVFRLYLDIGLIGLALYAAALVSVVRRLRRSVASAGDADAAAGAWSRAAIAAVVCYASTLLTDNTLNYVTQFGVWVFGLAGAAPFIAPVAVTARPATAPGMTTRRLFPNVID